MATRTPSVLLLVVALLFSTAALAFEAGDLPILAVFAVFGSATALALEFARMTAPENRFERAFFSKLMQQAEAGRRLAIYDRDTGLFAHWYVALRGQEECARAARYGRKLSLLIIEPRDGAADGWEVKAEIGRWFQKELRATDVAGYLGNGRYVILAPEADSLAIAQLVERLREKIEHVEVGTSAFPEDGVAFQQLWKRATSRLQEPDAHARAA